VRYSEAEEIVKKLGFKSDGKFSTVMSVWEKGELSVTVVKVRSNLNLKSVNISHKRSKTAYVFKPKDGDLETWLIDREAKLNRRKSPNSESMLREIVESQSKIIKKLG